MDADGRLEYVIEVGRAGFLPAPPPSEPCVRFSRTRLSGRWFTSERIDRPARGPRIRRTTRVRQRRHWASGCEAEPFTAFHPLFEGRQHAIRPDLRFDPAPSGPDLSGLLSLRHCRRCGVHRSVHLASTFLRPLAPHPLQALRRYYGRSDSCPALSTGQVSPIHVHGLPTIPPPTTPRTPAAALTRYPSARRVSCFHGSRLRHSYAGSPDTSGRIEFVILRTGRSPPVASHPASRRRSYIRLQAGERIPEADLHRSDRAHSRAHVGPGHVPANFSPTLPGDGAQGRAPTSNRHMH